ncbi:MAG: nucleotidyltransferase family protein, partial [Gammaproteobacteria bacterium]|nr:nucleotidyltransferase family protein [Gammaproteobacteria bacterium]
MIDIEKSLLEPEATVRDALAHIEASDGKIALVVDRERRLIGTVTDGDIRRSLLAGHGVEIPVSQVMNPNPLCADLDMPDEEVLSLMRDHVVRHIPLVDGSKRIVGIRTIQEILQPVIRNNWIVIMAGGRGERLHPLTRNTSKPMLEVGGRPILESTVQRCAAAGFQRIFLAINYQSTSIKNYFRDGSKFGISIEYLEEDKPLGTAGSLTQLPESPSEAILIMNGDILTNLDLGQLLSFHKESVAVATMAVRDYEVQIPYGVVEVEGDELRSLHEKPYHRHYVNAGIYVVDPDLIAQIP